MVWAFIVVANVAAALLLARASLQRQVACFNVLVTSGLCVNAVPRFLFTSL